MNDACFRQVFIGIWDLVEQVGFCWCPISLGFRFIEQIEISDTLYVDEIRQLLPPSLSLQGSRHA